jgi:hypothetical protein
MAAGAAVAAGGIFYNAAAADSEKWLFGGAFALGGAFLLILSTGKLVSRQQEEASARAADLELRYSLARMVYGLLSGVGLALFGGCGIAEGRERQFDLWPAVMFWGALILAGVILAGVYARKLTRRSVQVFIGQEGVRDLRQGDMVIPWSTVTAVKLEGSRVG